MKCKFCSKEYTSKIGLSNHQTRCPQNPNRQLQILTEDGRKRISEKTRKNNLARNSDLEFKKRHQQAMRDAVKKYPESYNSSNRGRTKQIIVDGIKFHGKWEVEFYQYCKNNNIQVLRSNEWFEYEWNGLRKYFPDFFLPELNLYVEIKGYETERDRAKWSQFPKSLCIIKEVEIKKIREGVFKGPMAQLVAQ